MYSFTVQLLQLGVTPHPFKKDKNNNNYIKKIILIMFST